MMRNRVFELRSARRLTQEDLAQALGVTRQTVISLEQNKYVPSLEMGFKVARFFDKTVEDVFTYEAAE